MGYSTALKNFDPKSLLGSWYKTDGLNPNYDLFDCQTNTFSLTKGYESDASELDMGIFFRVSRPASSGGGFWVSTYNEDGYSKSFTLLTLFVCVKENSLTEHMIIDGLKPKAANDDSSGRTMHTGGKMYGLSFDENWYIIGESDGKGDVPEFKVVAYKGHTLQGNYEGSFIYAKEPVLPSAAIPAVKDVLSKAGLDFDKFTRIDNTW